MAHDALETTIEDLAVVLDAQKDAAAHAHTQMQYILAELRELVTLLREQHTAAVAGDESLRHRIRELDTTLRRCTWKVLTVTGSLLLGACVIWSVLVIASEQAERHRERRQDAHYKAIALGLDRYRTTTLYGQLSTEQCDAIDAIYAQAHAVSPGHR